MILHALSLGTAIPDCSRADVFEALEQAGAEVSTGKRGQIIVRFGDYIYGFARKRDVLTQEELLTIQHIMRGIHFNPRLDWPLEDEGTARNQPVVSK
ncbi:hypothetical protein CKO45_25870 [Paracraurococcus ruber]|uniref:Type II toxin-antitoxin system HicA family toxin n=1 Tax=Paracraurococcus ruber TaxID=77675 RepID=A0ABS1D6Z1_9PROT|nr:hypothetical protein [Paracraurococcus ruber]